MLVKLYVPEKPKSKLKKHNTRNQPRRWLRM